MVNLEAQGAKYTYPGEVHAVRGLDLELKPGELHGVLGPNGAGKSTLLRLLGGLLPPEAGQVRLDGTPVASIDPKARARQVAMVPQSLDALPDLTVHDFVAQGRYAHQGFLGRRSPGDAASIARAMEESDLSDLTERLMPELSGGQRQRALVARALAQEAKLLLVDEPTTALDPEHQIAVMHLLARLVENGHGVLLVTHDLNLASQFATRISLMQDGRIVAQGTPGEVFRPEVLKPIYGSALRYESVQDGDRVVPVVLPWDR